VFWLEKKGRKCLATGTDEPTTKDGSIIEILISEIPKEIYWMKRFADAGLPINGRQVHAEDNEDQKEDITTIGEIIYNSNFIY